MGLFDKLKQAGMDMLNDVTTEEQRDKAMSFLNDAAKNVREYAQQETARQEAEEEKKTACEYEDGENEENLNTPGPCRDKLLQALAEEFPAYTVKQDVSPATVGGTGRFMNYSLGIYDGGTPKLFIMIIGKTTCAHREYRWAKEAAAAAGVPMINFVQHYPNRPEYIRQRLHEYLG